MMKSLTTLLFALLLSIPCLAMTHQEDRVEAEIENKTKSLDYLIALPKGYDPTEIDGDAVPLTIAVSTKVL